MSRTKILLPIILGLLTSCGAIVVKPPTEPTAAAAVELNITGVAMLGGPCQNSTINVYRALADGTPDTTTAPLATTSTDTLGRYSITLLAPNEILVLQLEHGFYREVATENIVSITTPLHTILSLNNAVSLNAMITPLTEMAAQNYFLQGTRAMMAQAMQDSEIMSVEFRDKAQAFEDRNFDPNFFNTDPEFKTIFEKIRTNSVFQNPNFRGNLQRFATQAAFAVGQAFGVPDMIGTTPGNPAIGADTQDSAAYLLALASMSRLGFHTSQTTIDVMQTFGKQFAQHASFPDFTEFSKISDSIIKGKTMPDSFHLFAAPFSKQDFVQPTYNSFPSFTPP